MEKKERKKASNRSWIRKQEAIKLVYNDILDLVTYSVIKQKLMEDLYHLDYNYSESSVQDIYNEAMKAIKADYQKQKEDVNSQLVAAITDIVSEAKEEGNKMLALQGIDRLMKIYHIDDNKQNISVKTQDSEIEINFGFNET